jgi:hypothetical protein
MTDEKKDRVEASHKPSVSIFRQVARTNVYLPVVLRLSP